MHVCEHVQLFTRFYVHSMGNIKQCTKEGMTNEGGYYEGFIVYMCGIVLYKWKLSPTCAFCSFKDHAEINSTILRSQTNTARVEGLRSGTVYVVQVRARTVAGFGKYSSKMCFQTLTDGKDWRARRNVSLGLSLAFSL